MVVKDFDDGFESYLHKELIESNAWLVNAGTGFLYRVYDISNLINVLSRKYPEVNDFVKHSKKSVRFNFEGFEFRLERQNVILLHCEGRA